MRWTSYCLIKHIYLEPINTSKPHGLFEAKQMSYLYILWSRSTRHKSFAVDWGMRSRKMAMYIHSERLMISGFFLRGKGNITQVKSLVRSQTRLSQCDLFQFEAAQKNTPFFSRTKAWKLHLQGPGQNYCNLRVASPTFPSVPKAQSHNQKFSPKFLAFFA